MNPIDKKLEKHLPMIHSIINRFYIPNGLDRDDLVQAGLIGIWRAEQQYKSNRNTKFSTYAYKSARNEILSLLRTQSKYAPEQLPFFDDTPELSYEIEKEVLERFIKEDLEKEERLLIHYLYQGYKQREIAKLLHTSQPRICQRIRQLRIKGQRKWGNLS